MKPSSAASSEPGAKSKRWLDAATAASPATEAASLTSMGPTCSSSASSPSNRMVVEATASTWPLAPLALARAKPAPPGSESSWMPPCAIARAETAPRPVAAASASASPPSEKKPRPPRAVATTSTASVPPPLPSARASAAPFVTPSTSPPSARTSMFTALFPSAVAVAITSASPPPTSPAVASAAHCARGSAGATDLDVVTVSARRRLELRDARRADRHRDCRRRSPGRRALRRPRRCCRARRCWRRRPRRSPRGSSSAADLVTSRTLSEAAWAFAVWRSVIVAALPAMASTAFVRERIEPSAGRRPLPGMHSRCHCPSHARSTGSTTSVPAVRASASIVASPAPLLVALPPTWALAARSATTSPQVAARRVVEVARRDGISVLPEVSAPPPVACCSSRSATGSLPETASTSSRRPRPPRRPAKAPSPPFPPVAIARASEPPTPIAWASAVAAPPSPAAWRKPVALPPLPPLAVASATRGHADVRLRERARGPAGATARIDPRSHRVLRWPSPGSPGPSRSRSRPQGRPARRSPSCRPLPRCR